MFQSVFPGALVPWCQGAMVSWCKALDQLVAAFNGNMATGHIVEIEDIVFVVEILQIVHISWRPKVLHGKLPCHRKLQCLTFPSKCRRPPLLLSSSQSLR